MDKLQETITRSIENYEKCYDKLVELLAEVDNKELQDAFLDYTSAKTKRDELILFINSFD